LIKSIIGRSVNIIGSFEELGSPVMMTVLNGKSELIERCFLLGREAEGVSPGLRLVYDWLVGDAVNVL
jgi:hypothetical protein